MPGSDLAATFLDAVGSLSDQSTAFAAVSMAVAVLVILTTLFSVYVVWLRFRNTLRERTWEDRETRWTELTLEAVVGERTVEDMLGRVGSKERLPFLDFLLRYARRLRGRERERIKELAVPFLPALQSLLRSRDVFRRARAVQTLGTLGSEEQNEILLEALHDDSPFVSMLAARALAAYGGSAYAGAILANLDRFEAWGSEYVTSLLVSLGPEAAPLLRAIVQDRERAPKIRAVVADSLRSLHDLDAVNIAAEVLSESTHPDVVAPLLRLLRVLGGPEHLEVVRRHLRHEHFAVRAEAYSALGALSESRDEAPLLEGLEDPSPWVALHAARAMKARGRAALLRNRFESGGDGAAAAGQVLAEGAG